MPLIGVETRQVVHIFLKAPELTCAFTPCEASQESQAVWLFHEFAQALQRALDFLLDRDTSQFGPRLVFAKVTAPLRKLLPERIKEGLL